MDTAALHADERDSLMQRTRHDAECIYRLNANGRLLTGITAGLGMSIILFPMQKPETTVVAQDHIRDGMDERARGDVTIGQIVRPAVFSRRGWSKTRVQW